MGRLPARWQDLERKGDLSFDLVKNPSMTKTSFAKECDINVIVARAQKTGILPVSSRVGLFGDFSKVGTFHDAQNAIVEANAAFGMLPAEVRDRFDNDPGKLIAWINDPANNAEAMELGFIAKPPVVHKEKDATALPENKDATGQIVEPPKVA